MQISFHVARNAIMALAAIACVLGVRAQDQVSVTSPTNGSTVSMPVWLRAHASECNGSSNMTAFGYSINDSPFITWGTTAYDIDNNDFRFASQPSPGAQYTIHYKAWSDAGACQDVPIVVNVSGPATTTVSDVNDSSNFPNAPNWTPTPAECGTASGAPDNTWFWMWDSGTGGCTISSDTNTYAAPAGSPTMDNKTRLFYVDWQYNPSFNGLQDPSERYSIDYQQNASAADYFVYDTYIYITDPQNLQNIEMDTNQVDSSGNVLILGLECVHSANTWEFTTYDPNTGGSTWRNPVGTGWTQDPCDPQKWPANTWNHVQLAGHRDSSGDAFYDAITFNGTTTFLSGWNGYSTFPLGWNPGDLVLNFQLDGDDCPNGTTCPPYPEMTATVYVDGMNMIFWTQ